MFVRTLVAGLALTAVFAGAAAAQCPNVSLSQYGSGCASQFDVPELAGSFDPLSCTVTLKMSGLPGCCNTFLTSKFVFLGLNQIALPVPSVGPGCTLLVDPIIVTVLPGNVTSLSVPVPASAVGVKGFMQVVNQYVTFGTVSDFNMSNGLAFKIG